MNLCSKIDTKLWKYTVILKNLHFSSIIYSQLPIKYITINLDFHNVESILEHMFFYEVCLPVNSLENEPTFKAFFKTISIFFFFLGGGGGGGGGGGETKPTPILLKFGIWVSFGMHHKWVKGHKAT